MINQGIAERERLYAMKKRIQKIRDDNAKICEDIVCGRVVISKDDAAMHVDECDKMLGHIEEEIYATYSPRLKEEMDIVFSYCAPLKSKDKSIQDAIDAGEDATGLGTVRDFARFMLEMKCLGNELCFMLDGVKINFVGRVTHIDGVKQNG